MGENEDQTALLALRATAARYRLILESSTEFAIIAADADRRITEWNAGAQKIFQWREEEVLGRPADIIFTAEDRADGAPLRETSTADAKGRAIDDRWHVRKDGTRLWGSGMMFPLRDGARGYLKILYDRTEHRNAEERQKLLLSELQHRVRNILAVVRSLARRTIEMSPTLQEFEQGFDGRLATLARTQNVLTRSGEISLELGELVRDELAAVGAALGEHVKVSGPEVKLRHRAAEALALATHELATNALKHGALAVEGGRLEVSWRVVPSPAGRLLSMEWREQGVSFPDGAPTRSGFGRELIEQGLPYELGAATSLEFSAAGLRAIIQFPLDAGDERDKDG